MEKKNLKSKNRFFISLLVLSLSLVTMAAIPRPSWAETPAEKAQKEADKKAAEAKKKSAEAKKEADKKAAEAVKQLADMHKRAEESVNCKFDKFKASTLITVKTEKVRSQSEIMSMLGDLYLTPNATVVGEVTKQTNPAAAPKTVQLFFWANADNQSTAKYINTKELDILLDGKPAGSFPVTYEAGQDGEVWLEDMIAEVPYATFRRMVSPKVKMEGRLGDMEFKFNDYQKILYNTLLKRISPAAK